MILIGLITLVGYLPQSWGNVVPRGVALVYLCAVLAYMYVQFARFCFLCSYFLHLWQSVYFLLVVYHWCHFSFGFFLLTFSFIKFRSCIFFFPWGLVFCARKIARKPHPESTLWLYQLKQTQRHFGTFMSLLLTLRMADYTTINRFCDYALKSFHSCFCLCLVIL